MNLQHASAAVAEALALMRDGHSTDAERLLQQHVRANPNDYQAWHLMAGILYRQQQWKKAADAFRQAVSLNPNSPQLWSKLAAAEHHQQHFDEARVAYEQALIFDPSHSESIAGLGHLFCDVKQPELALEFLKSVPKDRNQSADTFTIAGRAHLLAGRLAEAEASLRQAVALAPQQWIAWHNLAATCFRQGNVDEAEGQIRRVLAELPHHAESWALLGAIQKSQARFADCANSFRRAVEFNPQLFIAWHELGAALDAQTCLDDATVAYHRAVILDPHSAEARYNLGNVLRRRCQFGLAIEYLADAIRIRPEFVGAHNCLGICYQQLAEIEVAAACYRQALLLDPDFAEGHLNLANVLREQHKLDEAEAHYRLAIELKPNLAAPYSNLGNVLRDQGRFDEALDCLRRARQLDPSDIRAASSFLYALSFCPGCDAATNLAEHRRWNEEQVLSFGVSLAPHHNSVSINRRLRIGYVSPDFRNHVLAIIASPLFSSHDHSRFEIICYSDVIRPDKLSARFRSQADFWRDTAGLADEQLAQQIRQDKIDILIDLTMHMANSRPLLFARKPAPVQVCWFAYPGTTGLTAIDYRLTDPYLDPPGLTDQYYSEKSIRLADTFWCYDPLAEGPGVNPLPANVNGFITFGSLNNFCKVNDRGLSLWARVLRTVDRSRLMMLSPEGSHRRRVLDVLSCEGVTPDRVTFVEPRLRSKYLELYHDIDIGLDTIPYNGHTTSLDSYWMGIPVVTLVGETVVGRAGASQLTNLNLSELIAYTPDEFAAIAAKLASNLDALANLRAGLRNRMERSPLMNAERFARNIEAAYRQMWHEWCGKHASG